MKSKLIIVIIVVVAGLAVPAYLLMSDSGQSGVVEPSVPTSEAEATFLTLASQLVPLSFDTSMLTDSRFTSLIDLHTAILPEQKGRKDPFAVLGR